MSIEKGPDTQRFGELNFLGTSWADQAQTYLAAATQAEREGNAALAEQNRQIAGLYLFLSGQSLTEAGQIITGSDQSAEIPTFTERE